MALRGTLKDFGIADIFQLIGQQGKTGILTARNRAQHVTTYFHEGAVVRAEAAGRQRIDLLGNMLLRAEVITDDQLAKALEKQKKSARRLGDILLEGGALNAEILRMFIRLQTTETIYQLFLWNAGYYEFKSADVEAKEGMELIRSESVLMEGFRQVDEWPNIRKTISGYDMVFRVLEDLDSLSAAEATQDKPAEPEEDMGFNEAFADFSATSTRQDARLRNIEDNERIVYRCIRPHRDVQKIIDLSRLGEFETCKALVNLVQAGIIEPIAESSQRKLSAAATMRAIGARVHGDFVPIWGILLCAGLALGLWYGVDLLGVDPVMVLSNERPMAYVDLSLQTQLARGQEGLIRAALDVYRAEQNSYPENLDALVRVGLLEPRDLTFPWSSQYVYVFHGTRPDDGYELRQPLYRCCGAQKP